MMIDYDFFSIDKNTLFLVMNFHFDKKTKKYLLKNHTNILSRFRKLFRPHVYGTSVVFVLEVQIDVVILVVAANDGVMPQTEEAINHAKAAGVSIVVAINKMDLQDADVERIKGDLAAKELTPEDWGGNIQMVPVSALKGDGVDKLLEAVALEAELLELKAHFKGQAQGVVIESEFFHTIIIKPI